MENRRGDGRKHGHTAMLGSILLLLLSPAALLGHISETTGLGDRASALGGAVTALPNDPTAVYYNPAGLTLLDGWRLWYDHAIFNGQAQSNNLTDGEKSRFGLELFNNRPTPILTGQLGQTRVALGLLGVGGLASQWPSDIGEKRFFGVDTKVLHATLTPALAYPVTPNFSIGATLEISAFTKIENRQLIGDGFVGDFASHVLGLPPGLLNTRNGTPDGTVLLLNDHDFPTGLKPNNTLTADFRHFSFITGLLYRPLSFMQVGVTYRERFKPLMVGKAKLGFAPEIKTAFLGLLPDDEAPFEADFLTRPRMVNLGVALQPLPRLLLLLDGQWSGWSDFRNLGIKIGRGRQGPGLGLLGQRRFVLPTRMHDTFAVRLGLEYELLHDLYVRLGYWLDKHPQSDRFALPATLPNDIHFLSLGSGWENAFGLPLYLGLYGQVGVTEPRRLSVGESRIAGGLKNFTPGPSERLLQFGPNDVEILTKSARFYSFGLTLEWRLFGAGSNNPQRARRSFLGK
ncbi:MAG: OmpP1/FadL family transporter [Candidatus Binatia bacterium]